MLFPPASSRFSGLVVALGAAAMVAVVPARADVKVVSRTSVSGGQAAARPGEKSITYYKGDRVRTESGQQVTIYDCAADRLYTLNPASKTYHVSSMKNVVTQTNPMMAMVDMKSVVTLKPGGKTKIISGKTARNYVWKAVITMSIKKGANTGAPPGAPIPTLPTLILDGEQWTTEAVKLSARCTRLNSAALMGGGGMPAGLKPLVEKLASVKGLPLQSRMTQTMKPAKPNPGAGPPPRQMVIKSELVSLSEATLPASLFAVPAGYKQVPRPMGALRMGAGGAGAPGLR